MRRKWEDVDAVTSGKWKKCGGGKILQLGLELESNLQNNWHIKRTGHQHLFLADSLIALTRLYTGNSKLIRVDDASS